MTDLTICGKPGESMSRSSVYIRRGRVCLEDEISNFEPFNPKNFMAQSPISVFFNALKDKPRYGVTDIGVPYENPYRYDYLKKSEEFFTSMGDHETAAKFEQASRQKIEPPFEEDPDD